MDEHDFALVTMPILPVIINLGLLAYSLCTGEIIRDGVIYKWILAEFITGFVVALWIKGVDNGFIQFWGQLTYLGCCLGIVEQILAIFIVSLVDPLENLAVISFFIAFIVLSAYTIIMFFYVYK